MDIQKVLLLIKEHGTSLFLFQVLLSLKIYSQHIQFDNNLSACSMEWLQVFNVFYQLLCLVSFTEADQHFYKLEWKQALSRTFKAIHQRSIFIFPCLCKIKEEKRKNRGKSSIATMNLLAQKIWSNDIFKIGYHAGGSTEHLPRLKMKRRNEESPPSDTSTPKKRKTRLDGEIMTYPLTCPLTLTPPPPSTPSSFPLPL